MKASDKAVIKLSIYAFGPAAPTEAISSTNQHTWLTVTNTTLESVYFLDYEILPWETMSISIWPDVSGYKKHGGVYINREEAEYINGRECMTYSIMITLDQLAEIAKNTPKESYYHDGKSDWKVGDNGWHNCTTYSTEMWNLVADEAHHITDGFLAGADIPGDVANKLDKWKGSSKITYYGGSHNITYHGEREDQKLYAKDVYYVYTDGTFLNCDEILLSDESLELNVEEEKEVTAKFYLEDWYTEEEVKEFIECESDNEEVAVVENGIVKAVGPGECNIRFYTECAGGGLIEKDCKVKVTDGEWKEAYAEIMRNYRSERSTLTTRFALGNVDDDKIPELFLMDGNFHMSKCTIYTWAEKENGEYGAVNLGEYGSSGIVDFAPGDGFLREGYMGQGYSISTYYRLSKGKLEKMENFVQETAGNPNVSPYVINDEEVSEEEFNSRLEKWNQLSSSFITASYDHLNDITDENLDILVNSDWETS